MAPCPPLAVPPATPTGRLTWAAHWSPATDHLAGLWVVGLDAVALRAGSLDRSREPRPGLGHLGGVLALEPLYPGLAHASALPSPAAVRPTCRGAPASSRRVRHHSTGVPHQDSCAHPVTVTISPTQNHGVPHTHMRPCVHRRAGPGPVVGAHRAAHARLDTRGRLIMAVIVPGRPPTATTPRQAGPGGCDDHGAPGRADAARADMDPWLRNWYAGVAGPPLRRPTGCARAHGQSSSPGRDPEPGEPCRRAGARRARGGGRSRDLRRTRSVLYH